MLKQVNDFDVVLPGQVLLADFLQVGECSEAFRGLPGNVKPQFVGLRCSLRAGAWLRVFHFHSPFSAIYNTSRCRRCVDHISLAALDPVRRPERSMAPIWIPWSVSW